jgi:hypothetical protein
LRASGIDMCEHEVYVTQAEGGCVRVFNGVFVVFVISD